MSQVDEQQKLLIQATVRETMNSPELRSMIREIVKLETKDTFVSNALLLGINTADPIAMQQDFSFLRTLRLASAQVKMKTAMIVLTIVVTFIVGATWLGISLKLGHPPA